jgi:uncharacterized protein YbjT (DUF2867 family)
MDCAENCSDDILKEDLMKNILILGANGQIARFAIKDLLDRTDTKLTLYLRKADRIKKHFPESERIRIIDGDVLDEKKLHSAMSGQDIVYANLSGDMEMQSHNIVKNMKERGVKRIIFISSMGIYNEVPGEKYKSVLDPYRKSAEYIESTDLDYTIIRPEWLNNNDEIDYELTRKGELFKNKDALVSRKSVADLIVRLVSDEKFGMRESLGINKPA